MTRKILTALLVLVGGVLGSRELLRTNPSATRWEKEIAEIERRLKQSPPPPDALFFAGSSSIRRWDLRHSFPQLPVVNVGFGGSEIRDSTQFVDRLFVPFRPRVIVFYAGDNDLNSRRTPRQVRDDFAAFVQRVHVRLPETRIVFLAIKPSPKRLALLGEQREANQLIETLCQSDPRLQFVDVASPMLDATGQPRPELYDADALHLSPAGYTLWTEVVTKALTPG